MRCLLGWWCLCLVTTGWAQSNPFAQVAEAYLVEIDGQVVWSQASEQALAPASLTKLMTALLALEHLRPEAPLRVSRTAAAETGSRLGLRPGEQFQMQDLLAAALMASANDACRALAEGLDGSEQRFVQRMNRRAQELGLRHTHFVNACGHDAPQHRSSASDLALLAHALMRHPMALAWAGQTEASIAARHGGRRYVLKNKNALIGRYAGASGLKTGYTPAAGRCLVAYAQRGSHSVLLVMLRGKDRWWDAVDILDLAFERAAQAS